MSDRRRYYVGLVPNIQAVLHASYGGNQHYVQVGARGPSHRYVARTNPLASHVSVTIVFDDPEKAGDCLRVASAFTSYRDALSAVLDLGHVYRSANFHGQQLSSLVTGSDIWAAVMYNGDRRAVSIVHGTAGHLNSCFADFVDGKRFSDTNKTDGITPELIFLSAAVGALGI